ncbi:hypothetical protein BJX64DRAFT_214847 [Aspergillus heterothallicus]
MLSRRSQFCSLRFHFRALLVSLCHCLRDSHTAFVLGAHYHWVLKVGRLMIFFSLFPLSFFFLRNLHLYFTSSVDTVEASIAHTVVQ